MVGQVYHHPEGQKKWLSKYSPKFPFLIPVITIDGLFISFNKTKIKHKFDETIGKFHFYDHLFCVPNYLDEVKIGVTTSFEITHESVGQPNQEFWESREKFVGKWGSRLPLDLKPESVYFEKIIEKPWLTASCIAATARSASARSGSIALKSKKIASVSRSVPNGLKAREVSAQPPISWPN